MFYIDSQSFDRHCHTGMLIIHECCAENYINSHLLCLRQHPLYMSFRREEEEEGEKECLLPLYTLRVCIQRDPPFLIGRRRRRDPT